MIKSEKIDNNITGMTHFNGSIIGIGTSKGQLISIFIIFTIINNNLILIFL